MRTRESDRATEAEAAVRELLADAALAALLASDGPPGFFVESVEAEARKNPLRPSRDHVVVMVTIVLPTAREQSLANELVGWLHAQVADRAATTQDVTLASWVVDPAGEEDRDLRPRAVAIFTA
jgi:hypothetical protein